MTGNGAGLDRLALPEDTVSEWRKENKGASSELGEGDQKLISNLTFQSISIMEQIFSPCLSISPEMGDFDFY